MVQESGQKFLSFCHNSHVLETDGQMLVARQWLHSYSMVKMDQQLLNTNCDPLHLPLTLSEPDGILWLECDEFNSADLLNNKDSIRQCQQHMWSQWPTDQF